MLDTVFNCNFQNFCTASNCLVFFYRFVFVLHDILLFCDVLTLSAMDNYLNLQSKMGIIDNLRSFSYLNSIRYQPFRSS